MKAELQNLSLLGHKDYCNYITEDMKTGEQQVKCSKSVDTQRPSTTAARSCQGHSRN